MPRGFQHKRRVDLEELPPGFSDTRKDFFRFLLRKGRDLIFTLFLMSIIVFLLFYIIPVDTLPKAGRRIDLAPVGPQL